MSLCGSQEQVASGGIQNPQTIVSPQTRSVAIHNVRAVLAAVVASGSLLSESPVRSRAKPEPSQEQGEGWVAASCEHESL